MMMKLLSLVMVCSALWPGALMAEEKPVVPKVEVYLIRKLGVKENGSTQMDATVLEISNPTDRTFYVRAPQIQSLHRETQVKRGEKWYALPTEVCGTGDEFFPFKPGAKTLISVDTPLDEEVLRFRFPFFTTDDAATAKVVSVMSREILRKEFSDFAKTDPEKKVEDLWEVVPDEELNKVYGKGAEPAEKPDADGK